MKLILARSVRQRSQFILLQTSATCPNTACWNDCSFTHSMTIISLLKINVDMWVYFWSLSSVLGSMCLSYSTVMPWLMWLNFYIEAYQPSSFAACFDCSGSHISLLILGLQCQLLPKELSNRILWDNKLLPGNITVVTIVSLLIQEHGILFHIF